MVTDLIYYREYLNDFASPFGDLAYQSLVIQDGGAFLKGYWKYDETSGTSFADSSGNNNTGTGNSGTIAGQTPAISVGHSCKFDGSSGNVTVGSNSGLDAQSGEYAIEGWLKFTGTAYALVFGKFDSFTTNGPIVWANVKDNVFPTTGYIQMQDAPNATGHEVTTVTNGLNDGVFRHYVWQRRNYSGIFHLEVYINGVLDNSTTQASPQNAGDTNNLLMGGNGGIQLLNGTEDEMAFYVGMSLTPNQILTHAHAR